MSPNELLEELQKMDFEYFMQKALERVPDNIDKREGSVIYDALAPACYNMAEVTLNFYNMNLNSYVQTAVGEFLDYRAIERGMKRKAATNAKVAASFIDSNGKPIDIDLKTRFSSVGNSPIYYQVIEKVLPGKYILESEEVGQVANKYTGQILPISNINGFGFGEVTKVEVPARDIESDDELRTRILESNVFSEYGGNVSDYIKIIKSMKDVGAVQVYPTWNGGGTVKLVIVDNNFNIPSIKLVKDTQEVIDPTDNQGNGYGIAPIGHKVTVDGPTARTLDFSLSIDLDDGLSSSDLNPQITKAINDFIDSLKRTKWNELRNERSYQMIIYRSQLISALLKIEGILNVSKIKINNQEKDIKLTFDNKLQELPVVGSVVVNA
ncbi:baseplate J/gp47 family protein [Fructilactobacillus vespulae]|uniref:baseplate J/gp47 family protein n=1 Tax=Fructilactobacillus vespulae TaxID=1249630 RepID=UPI0039B66805